MLASHPTGVAVQLASPAPAPTLPHPPQREAALKQREADLAAAESRLAAAQAELGEAERRVRSGADSVAEGLVAQARAEADAILQSARDECRRAEDELRVLREQLADAEAAVKRREVAAEAAADEARRSGEAAAAEQRRAAEVQAILAEKEALLRNRWALVEVGLGRWGKWVGMWCRCLLKLLTHQTRAAFNTVPIPREDLLAGKEREVSKREAALSGAEQRVAQLTRRLESDLQLTSPGAAAAAGGFPSSQLRASLDSLGAAPHSAASAGRGSAATAATASVSKQAQPSRLGSQPLPAVSQPAASSGFSGMPSGGTYATPASSLLQRSASLETPHLQQAPPHSAASTAAGPSGLALRRDSFASLDGTPDRQAALAHTLRQLQAATEKGANR